MFDCLFNLSFKRRFEEWREWRDARCHPWKTRNDQPFVRPTVTEQLQIDPWPHISINDDFKSPRREIPRSPVQALKDYPRRVTCGSPSED